MAVKFYSKKSGWLGVLSALSMPLMAAINDSDWPSAGVVETASAKNQFGGNLSDLFYQPSMSTEPAILWAVQNSPSKLYNMVWSPAQNRFVNNTRNGWAEGKTLHYPDGTGAPDAEGVTRAEASSSAMYVASERDGRSEKNRFSVLRYDTQGSAAALTATQEWNLTPDLPFVPVANRGLEAIAWIPDSYLQAQGFIDERTSQPYKASNYPAHGGGLFLVGLEATGQIFAYALNSDGSYQRIATISSGHPQMMALSFDRDKGELWAYCDNHCGNKTHVLAIDTVAGSATLGRFIIRAAYNRPASMANINNEGIAMTPDTECVNHVKPFFWADDDETAGVAIRRGTVSCGAAAVIAGAAAVP